MKVIVGNIVQQAIDNAIKDGALVLPGERSISIEISRTKDPKFGDYATNIALVLAGPLKRKPRELAEIIVNCLPKDGKTLSDVQVAGPGFINFFLGTSVWNEVLNTVHFQDQAYGRRPDLHGRNVIIEFVSANPTGPLHVGHGRGAAVGDSMARLLRASGFRVTTEYYVNDAGNQMRILGRSLLLRYREIMGQSIDFPDDHYKGEYIGEMALQLKDTEIGRRLLELPEEQALDLASRYAGEKILDGIKDDLRFFGVEYDNYFSERELHDKGSVQATIDELKGKNKVEEHGGALWFKMEGSEDEKDRVMVRATGEPTYFAADAAYHRYKLMRGFDLLVNLWGSDHHGYVPRVKAAVEALGYPPEVLRVQLVQFVNLVREGRKISMSTRSGEFVTLREVLDEVGPDAARFFFLTKRSDSHLDFDLDLAKKQSRENPVYYVQYVHARISGIFRIGRERGINVDIDSPDLDALTLVEERKIIKSLGDFPDMLSEAAEALEPHRVTFYLLDLAELFHAYYHDNRVLTEDSRIKKARLYLVEAVRKVIANGLNILGVSAPERM
jgi:arginyl-tRNA synthetase